MEVNSQKATKKKHLQKIYFNICARKSPRQLLFYTYCKMESRKTLRSTKQQIDFMLKYMACNQAFAAGDFRSPQGAKQYEEEWARLKSALDELGPKRTVGQWKICWRDQKRKARIEGGEHARAVNATGNAIPVPDLSDGSALVLCAIGTEMAVGMGPAESQIGMPAEIPASPRPPPAAPRRNRQRARRAIPSQNFLDAQLELNQLIRELVTEVRRSNELREEHLAFVRSSKSSSQ